MTLMIEHYLLFAVIILLIIFLIHFIKLKRSLDNRNLMLYYIYREKKKDEK